MPLLLLVTTISSAALATATLDFNDTDFIDRKFAHIKYNDSFKIVSTKSEEKTTEDGGVYVVAHTIIEGNLDEYISLEKAKGRFVTSLKGINKEKTTNETIKPISISANFGDVSFSGSTLKKLYNDDLHMGIYAFNGNIDLLTGGFTGARLTVNTVSQISKTFGASEFTDLQTKVEVDWDLYGFVGGTSFFVTTYYYITPSWATGLLSEYIDKTESGLIAYTALTINGKYSYKRYGTQYLDTVMADLVAD